MAFIKTTLTDEVTGKNVEYCFNTEQIIALSPARNTTEVTFITGQQVLVDLPYAALTKFIGAKDKLD
jgi:hypothetical protein